MPIIGLNPMPEQLFYGRQQRAFAKATWPGQDVRAITGSKLVNEGGLVDIDLALAPQFSKSLTANRQLSCELPKIHSHHISLIFVAMIFFVIPDKYYRTQNNTKRIKS